MSMAGGNPMQMMFPGFQAQSNMSPQVPLPSVSVPTNPVVRGPVLSTSGGGSSSTLPGSLSVSSNGVRQSGSSSMAGAQASPSCSTTPPPFPSPFNGQGRSSSAANQAGNYQLPFMLQGGVQWPTWVGGPGITPRIPGSNVSAAAEETRMTTPPAVNTDVETEFGAGQIAVWEESKRTRQRKLQRLTKNVFQVKSSDWPMHIDCDEKGEPVSKYRIFIHRVFRIVAKRWLDFNLIKFRDQSTKDLNLVKEEIDMRFTFTPPLRPDYIIDYLVDTMRTSRYQWHRHWKRTGKGQKHPQCPAENFPTLQAHWVALDAKAEKRRLEQDQNAHLEEDTDALYDGASPSATEVSWDVSLIFYDNTFQWSTICLG